ncbi:MAG: tRNA (adenosine(37)-N6)-threonylcarbamoyltransferase complex dimerization subunit type 1 TsaB [Clostridia bacterium]|nr:tRNA (adenosine(37)-N6)-threonylcarbamoyltransferase complex dimerization subunit type 1 TsaB [Clostridia bacterium]
MKNFLAIDTSNDYLTVLAAKDGRFALSHLPDCAMRHSVTLMGEVDKVLKELSLKAEECDFFAASVGAGSFTGIRIGIAAAKGFCAATGKPSLPVTSFEIAAYNGIDGGEKTLCLIDALHDAYYACGFDREKKVIFPPAYLEKEEVLALQREGYALRTLSRSLDLPKCTLVDPVEGLKNAVLAKAEKGEFAELIALYARKSSAEINLGRGGQV